MGKENKIERRPVCSQVPVDVKNWIYHTAIDKGVSESAFICMLLVEIYRRENGDIYERI